MCIRDSYPVEVTGHLREFGVLGNIHHHGSVAFDEGQRGFEFMRSHGNKVGFVAVKLLQFFLSFTELVGDVRDAGFHFVADNDAQAACLLYTSRCV